MNFTISCFLSTEFLIGLMIFHQQLSNRIASVRISAPEPFFHLVTASSHEAIEKLAVDVTLMLVCVYVFYNHHHSVY